MVATLNAPVQMLWVGGPLSLVYLGVIVVVINLLY